MQLVAARCMPCSWVLPVSPDTLGPLGGMGADVVYVVEHPGLERYNPEVYAATVAERIRSGQYRAAFFTTSAEGRDLAPRVAAQLGVEHRLRRDGVRDPE